MQQDFSLNLIKEPTNPTWQLWGCLSFWHAHMAMFWQVLEKLGKHWKLASWESSENLGCRLYPAVLHLVSFRLYCYIYLGFCAPHWWWIKLSNTTLFSGLGALQDRSGKCSNTAGVFCGIGFASGDGQNKCAVNTIQISFMCFVISGSHFVSPWGEHIFENTPNK